MKKSNEIYNRLTVLNTVILIVALTIIIFVFAAFRVPVLRVLDGFFQSEQFSSEALQSVQKIISGEPDQKPLSIFELKIKSNYMRQVDQLAKRLVKKGFMTTEDRLWVPATFWADGNQYKVKVRLRGDYQNHWQRSKKSWRVKFKKDNLFRNYREINLVLPEDRQNEMEHVAFSMGRKIGLLVPDSGFASVKINNVKYGGYFWFEQMSKETLERLRYPEGEIFSDTDAWIDNRTASAEYDGGLRYPEFELHPSFYKSKIHRKLESGMHIASRWRKFLELIATASQETIEREIPYFVNLKKFVTWSSATWMFGSTHAQESANIRWYYNTTTGLFEPLLYDIYMFIPPAWSKAGRNFNLSTFEAETPNGIVSRILRIPEVQQMRNQRLWELLDQFDDLIIKPAKASYARLRSSLPQGVDRKYLHRTDSQHEIRLKDLKQIRVRLKRHLSFIRLFAEPIFHLESEQPRLEIKLVPDGMANLNIDELALSVSNKIPIELIPSSANIRLAKATESKSLEFSINSNIDETNITFKNLSLYSKRSPDLQQNRSEWILTLNFSKKDVVKWARAISTLKVSGKFNNSVTGEPIKKRFIRWSRPTLISAQKPFISPVMPIDQFIKLSTLPFQIIRDTLILEAGIHELNRELIIPAGYSLTLQPGVTLRMGPKASILIRRRLKAAGTLNAPINIIAKDPKRPWGTIAVVSAKMPSSLQHVIISGGSEAWIQGIYLSGQVSFYSSDVYINNSVITKGNADDGLNIKHARFSIANTRIESNSSDGFDGDWVTGTIKNSALSANGGDGGDFSGSQILFLNTVIRGMGDKGISAGEKSRIVVFNSLIRNSKIGIASKDLSHVSIYASAFVNNQTALSLYRKKSIFGGGKTDVTSSLFLRNSSPVDVDAESQITLMNSAISTKLPKKGVGKKGLVTTAITIGDIRDFSDQGIFIDKSASEKFRLPKILRPQPFLGVKFPDLSNKVMGMIRLLDKLP
jgi:spore coat protein CotH